MEVADAQGGLITSTQLRALGVHTGMVSRWVAGYMWTRVLPGVHLVRGGEPTRFQRELAALLYAGERSQLTGSNALRHYAVRSARLQEVTDDNHWHPEPVHVLVPHDRRRASAGYVRIERTRRLPTPLITTSGLALAPIARAAADASRRWRNQADVYALATELVRRQLLTPDELEAELRAGSRRGSAHLRAALTHARAGSWSGAEAELRNGLLLTGLPEPVWNQVVVSANGLYLGRPDGWFDDVALALEADSIEHHSLGKGFENTVSRNARYARHGILVYPVLPSRITHDLHVVLQEIRQAYHVAAERPRPPVRLVVAADASAGREEWRWGA